ncbi:MAG: outer membrane protein OmpA-like peptidoglycan-associated protein [Crocinitomix sp.]|jgi:outer membrane protein OmpA-like peptidoglycan-associated protein
MKKLILLSAALSLVFVSTAQESTGKEKKAHAAFESFSYNKAIDKYSELDASSLVIKRNKALSHMRMHESVNAESLFREIVNTDGHTADDVYNYASVLRENEKYEDSEEWMKKYANMNVTDSRGILHMKELGSYQRMQKESPDFTVKNLDINSEQQDFAAMFYKDQVVFASSREGTKSVRRRWNWNTLPFLDVYIADKGADNSLTNANVLDGKVNKKFHEGPVAFNPAGDKMIFTRNNYDGESSKGVIRLQLFSSELADGKWGKPEALPFNDNEYSVGHATISNDGKWLYFASNMPGGIGGVDIYRAEIKEDGSYGKAVNLGERLNTEGDEMFPFIHAGSEMLFFSSNGRVGLGGLDVFLAQVKPEDMSIGKVMNLGAPINGSSDDFSLILNDEQTMGYFSSNRDGGKGSDDIYSFDLAKPFTFGKLIKGIAKDKKGEILAATEVTLFDLLTGEEEIVVTGDDGSYEFIVEEDKTFNLRGQKPKYFDGTNAADTHTAEEVIIVDLELEKDPGLSLYALITDKQTGAPLDSVKIILTDNMTGKEEIIYTPSSGDYLRPLMDKKLNDRGSYNIILEKNGYLGKTVTYNAEFDREGKYEVHADLDLTLEPIQVGADLSKIIDINPIYFDLNKSRIRPDAAIELDKIVKVMNENPTMVIELGSHTDSRGSDASNRSLSDRRAKASAKYVSERISNPDRIYGKGFGESTPNTVDATADGGSVTQLLLEDFINPFRSKNRKLFDKYHQFNRRTEFIIIKM